MNPPGTLAAARQALDRGSITAVELLEMTLQTVAHDEPEIRAFVTLTADMAREQAAKADARLATGERTPVLGIPMAVKDLVDVAGAPTTAGSRILHDNIASTSAPVWARLEAAGAVLVGKANTHEFAYGGTTEPTRNPADPRHMVGGSSGGPAAALAAGMCLGAVGSDTAGSIRIPANLCGVAGLKPTQGLVPAQGVVPLAPTLDVVGPMARTAADLESLLRVMADLPAHPYRRAEPPTVGLLTPPGPLAPAVAAAMDSAATALAALGSSVANIHVPDFEQSVADNFTIIGYEANRYHARWSTRRPEYTPYVRERLAQAAQVTEQQYRAALTAAQALASHLDSALSTVDVLLLPGVPFAAPVAYVETVTVAGAEEDRDTGLCRNTAFANLTGHPVLALPAGLDGDLPVGVQLVGRRGADLDLVTWGARLERHLPPGLPPHLLG